MFVGEGVDVDDAATDGVLAWVDNEVDTFELVVLECLDDEVHGDVGATGDGEGVAGEGARGDDFFVERFGIGDDDEVAASVELFYHFAAL